MSDFRYNVIAGRYRDPATGDPVPDWRDDPEGMEKLEAFRTLFSSKGRTIAGRLFDFGYRSLEDVSRASDRRLLEIPYITEKQLPAIRSVAPATSPLEPSLEPHCRTCRCYTDA